MNFFTIKIVNHPTDFQVILLGFSMSIRDFSLFFFFFLSRISLGVHKKDFKLIVPQRHTLLYKYNMKHYYFVPLHTRFLEQYYFMV